MCCVVDAATDLQRRPLTVGRDDNCWWATVAATYGCCWTVRHRRRSATTTRTASVAVAAAKRRHNEDIIATLSKRRETLAQRKRNRPSRNIYELDFTTRHTLQRRCADLAKTRRRRRRDSDIEIGREKQTNNKYLYYT